MECEGKNNNESCWGEIKIRDSTSYGDLDVDHYLCEGHQRWYSFIDSSYVPQNIEYFI